ncbi:N-acetylneuraminate synthase family protein, partial [bacterium AH-315-C07]|nr:N-acetylneuraminate synthase family protein [bacterium AH-315-C07]
IPMCTPWDIESVKVLEKYGIDVYKIASADMTNHDLVEQIANTSKPVICSTGMSSEAEIVQTTELLDKLDVSYGLLHCNSTYPPHMEDVNLSYLSRLAEISSGPIGYSGHERGFHIPVAAVALGARIIEKHFTFDKNMEGNDHKVSLLPEEFETMVKYIRDTEESLGTSNSREISQGELMNRVVLAKSLIANQDIKKGETVKEEMVASMGPGSGLQPIYKCDLIGITLNRDISEGDFFFESDINGEILQSRDYNLKRYWGIPVRYHDYKTLMSKSNPQFLEFHLSFKDMELDFEDFFDSQLDMGLTVHSPDTYTGDHLLNLASDDKEYRERSIRELQQVVDLTSSLSKYFTNREKPLIIVSVGGFTKNEFVKDKTPLYDRVADSLSKIDQKDTEIIPQTLPPYPWYFGGQLYCNLFTTPEDTVDFCEKYGYRICFDVSHSQLAANIYDFDLMDFVKLAGKHIAHLHLVDAKGKDSEGLQINEGDVDFHTLASTLDDVSPDASFIPEIWMGHENEGEKMWVALERLEKWF